MLLQNEQEQALFAADARVLPFMGSIFTGAVLAFACICTLLSIYMSFVAVPEGASSYIFMEPRGLIVMNGLLVFGSTHGVETIFSVCSNSVAGDSVVFALFCLLACWLDGIPSLAVGLANRLRKNQEPGDEKGNKKSGKISKIFRYATLQCMSLVPIIGLLVTHPGPGMPNAILVSTSLCWHSEQYTEGPSLNLFACRPAVAC